MFPKCLFQTGDDYILAGDEVNVRLRRSSLIRVEQIVPSAEEKAVCKVKAQV
jgi:hypothetical protein